MDASVKTTPLAELIATPGNEPPAGTVCRTMVASDGIVLRYAICPGPARPRGTVCVFKGRGDFIERHFETANDLIRRGFAVALFDFRGQGGSQRLTANPLKGHVGSFRDYDRDVEAFMSQAVMPDCPPPYFALAHSTGAHVLLRALLDHTWFDAAVLTSPLLGFGSGPVPETLIRTAARLAVWSGLGKSFALGQRHGPWTAADFPGNPLTSDLRRFTRDTRTIELAPCLGIGGPTYGWIHAAARSMATLRRLSGPDAFRCPVQIVAAGADRVVSLDAIMALTRRVPGVSTVVVEDARHELLIEHDRFREQFWAAFDAFIDARSLRPQDPVARAVASA